MRNADYPIHPMILSRWSPRAMSGEEISEKELLTLFEAARWAPSSYNNQPWRFIYARKNTAAWNLFLSLLVEANQAWAKNAAALIVICSKTTFDFNNKPSITHTFDAGAAWENLALQGSVNGLVVHGMQGFDYERAKTELGIPEAYTVEAMAAGVEDVDAGREITTSAGQALKAITEEIYKPVRNYLEHKDKTTHEDINPYYILPRMLQMRLQKTMDEYVAGVSTYYQTNGKLLTMGLNYLTMLKEDSQKMRAKDLHELLRAWENYHRIITAETHLRHILFREETRYPGFFYRADFPKLDEANWKCFVNSRMDPDTKEWTLMKKKHVDLVPKTYGAAH